MQPNERFRSNVLSSIAYLVFFDNLRESLETFSINGTDDALSIPTMVLESQGFQFHAGNSERWVGGNGNAYSILVKINGQNGVVKGLFPIQDRSDLGGFAQLAHQLGSHFGSN